MWLPQHSLWSFREWEWKLGSADTMEMNGHVNREVDWGAKDPREARSAIFSVHFFRSEACVICLTVKLVIVPPSIIGWPAIDRQCTFSFQLNYITKKKKRIANVCTLSGPHFCRPQQNTQRKERNAKTLCVYACVCYMSDGRVKQFCSSRLKLLFWRWQV